MAIDSEIQATAALLVERFGAEAPAKAYGVADGFAGLGSRERMEHWIRIAQAAECLHNRRAGDASDVDD